MNKRRIRDLIGAVEDAPAKRFNMFRYSSEHKCGTKHCAAGWYAVKFPRRGMYFDDGVISHKTDKSYPPVMLANHFDIHEFEARGLFSDRSEKTNGETRGQWLRRARKFLATGKI